LLVLELAARKRAHAMFFIVNAKEQSVVLVLQTVQCCSICCSFSSKPHHRFAFAADPIGHGRPLLEVLFACVASWSS
jgi:hypothetical protein